MVSLAHTMLFPASSHAYSLWLLAPQAVTGWALILTQLPVLGLGREAEMLVQPQGCHSGVGVDFTCLLISPTDW